MRHQQGTENRWEVINSKRMSPRTSRQNTWDSAHPLAPEEQDTQELPQGVMQGPELGNLTKRLVAP